MWKSRPSKKLAVCFLLRLVFEPVGAGDVSPKRQWIYIEVQKIVLFIVTAERTSEPSLYAFIVIDSE
jgi:hypothetical protein